MIQEDCFLFPVFKSGWDVFLVDLFNELWHEGALVEVNQYQLGNVKGFALKVASVQTLHFIKSEDSCKSHTNNIFLSPKF